MNKFSNLAKTFKKIGKDLRELGEELKKLEEFQISYDRLVASNQVLFLEKKDNEKLSLLNNIGIENTHQFLFPLPNNNYAKEVVFNDKKILALYTESNSFFGIGDHNTAFNEATVILFRMPNDIIIYYDDSGFSYIETHDTNKENTFVIDDSFSDFINGFKNKVIIFELFVGNEKVGELKINHEGHVIISSSGSINSGDLRNRNIWSNTIKLGYPKMKERGKYNLVLKLKEIEGVNGTFNIEEDNKRTVLESFGYPNVVFPFHEWESQNVFQTNSAGGIAL